SYLPPFTFTMPQNLSSYCWHNPSEGQRCLPVFFADYVFPYCFHFSLGREFRFSFSMARPPASQCFLPALHSQPFLFHWPFSPRWLHGIKQRESAWPLCCGFTSPSFSTDSFCSFFFNSVIIRWRSQ